MARPMQLRDAALPAGLLALSTVELVSLGLAPALPLYSLSIAMLMLRHRWPWAACTLVLVLIAAVPLFGSELDEPAAPILVAGIASYTMGRRLPDLRGLASMALFLPLLLASDSLTSDVTDLVFLCVMILPPYAAGLGVRTLAARNQRLTEQGEELLRLQEQVRRDATVAERGRIARELHDLIAHSVSAMVVQASAAEELAHRDPDRCAEAMHEVATTGRRALAETGRLLHLLRDSHDELGLAPDVGMSKLADLVEGFRKSGMAVSLDVDGALEKLPAGVDLSGYRIAQEALTNARKHGSGRETHVSVRRDSHVLTIKIVNEISCETEVSGSGLGLVGMAERVSVFGGSLEHGRADNGHWLLTATLPLNAGP